MRVTSHPGTVDGLSKDDLFVSGGQLEVLFLKS